MSVTVNIKREQHSFSEHDYYAPMDLNAEYDGNLENMNNNHIDVTSFEEVAADNGPEGQLGNGTTDEDTLRRQIEAEERMMFAGRERRTAKKPELFKFETNNNVNSKRRARSTNSMAPATSSSARRPAKNKMARKASKGAKYEVEYIWGKRLDQNGKTEYRVFWKYYPIEESTWEPEDNMSAAQESIDKYEEREYYFNKLGERQLKGKKYVSDEEEEEDKEDKRSAKQLKHVLPTMKAPKTPAKKKKKRGTTAQRNSSIPPLPKKKPQPPPPKKQESPLTGARKRKAPTFRAHDRLNFALSTGPMPIQQVAHAHQGMAIERQVARLAAQTIEEIVGHEPSGLADIPFFFHVRYGNGDIKRVSMSTLVDNSSKMLAMYLADALSHYEPAD